jgi:hypothetical protein
MGRDLRRALLIAAVVGTALCLVHSRALFGAAGTQFFRRWQLYANFAVPFLVSLISSRLARSEE